MNRRLRSIFLIHALLILLLTDAAGPATAADDTLPELVKKIQPGTVVVLTYDAAGQSLAQGSGFFISAEGDVITNYHVLFGASRAEIKTTTGQICNVTKILGRDAVSDLIRVAVEIPPNKIHPLKLAASPPEPGERIVVIGSPLGLEQSVSDGIVSAVRDDPRSGSMIQITAPISHGSSGSPVVNLKGEVIAVATLLSQEGQNLNFAVPAEKVAALGRSNAIPLKEWTKEAREKWEASAEGQVATALDAFIAKDYEKMVAVLKQAIRLKPDNADAHLYLGLAYEKLGRGDEAIESYKQAIRIEPDDAMAHFWLGGAYNELGRHAEAIEAYKQAIRIKPDDAKAHLRLGIAYNALRRYAEAIEACKQAIRLKPDYSDVMGRLFHAEAHFALGRAYGGLALEAEAIEAFKEAIRLKPDYGDAHFSLGLAYLLVADQGSALGEYKILKGLNPELANKLINFIYK